jgi:F-type H+-transporting ATPase subunit b
MSILLLLAADEAAHTAAAGHAEHAEVLAPANWLPGATALVVFSLAFLILWLKVWPNITKGLDEREAKIRNEIKSAEEARAAATAAQKQYEAELEKAQRQAQETIAKATADARAAAEELRRENDKELADMKLRAKREIETAKETAIAELHSHATTLAASMASRILQREISAGDQNRMLEESIAELANVRGN